MFETDSFLSLFFWFYDICHVSVNLHTKPYMVLYITYLYLDFSHDGV